MDPVWTFVSSGHTIRNARKRSLTILLCPLCELIPGKLLWNFEKVTYNRKWWRTRRCRRTTLFRPATQYQKDCECGYTCLTFVILTLFRGISPQWQLAMQYCLVHCDRMTQRHVFNKCYFFVVGTFDIEWSACSS
jgi:hypothetical protein